MDDVCCIRGLKNWVEKLTAFVGLIVLLDKKLTVFASPKTERLREPKNTLYSWAHKQTAHID